jgi:hypothetical protein
VCVCLYLIYRKGISLFWKFQIRSYLKLGASGIAHVCVCVRARVCARACVHHFANVGTFARGSSAAITSLSARPLNQGVRRSVWDPETSREQIGGFISRTLTEEKGLLALRNINRSFKGSRPSIRRSFRSSRMSRSPAILESHRRGLLVARRITLQRTKLQLNRGLLFYNENKMAPFFSGVSLERI